jgi:hypothetical protein
VIAHLARSLVRKEDSGQHRERARSHLVSNRREASITTSCGTIPSWRYWLASWRAQRKDCAPVAGKSTLSRLEHAPAEGPAFAPARYHKIGHDIRAIEELFVTPFLEAHARPPEHIVIDLDATDDPLHGHQVGSFFHGYYDCYCDLPLYIFCGRHLLAAKLRRANIDASASAVEEIARIIAQIRAEWPITEIWLRGDSGFAREASTTCSGLLATTAWWPRSAAS